MDSLRFAFPLSLLACAACVTPVPQHGAASYERAHCEEVPRPPTPEGLSGITRLKDGSYRTIDDRGGRLWTLNATFGASDRLERCVIDGKHLVLEGVQDGEGCAYDPLRDTIWVSDEAGPRVTEHDLATGRRIAALALPPFVAGMRPNRGPEALTISPDGLTLVCCTEEAVSSDGPLSSATNGTLVRICRYTRQNGDAPWLFAGWTPYRVDPIGGADYEGLACSGVSGLCLLSNGTLLVLERELSVKGAFLPTFRLRLYEAKADGTKQLVLDENTGFAMYEGICRVSEDAQGVSLLLVSDGDGLAAEMLLSVRLSRR